MQAVASIATPETDKELAEKYGAMGYVAKLSGKPRNPGVLNGYVRQWWLDGYDTGLSIEGWGGVDIGDGGTKV